MGWTRWGETQGLAFGNIPTFHLGKGTGGKGVVSTTTIIKMSWKLRISPSTPFSLAGYFSSFTVIFFSLHLFFSFLFLKRPILNFNRVAACQIQGCPPSPPLHNCTIFFAIYNPRTWWHSCLFYLSLLERSPSGLRKLLAKEL